jgi:hypothetical protein
MAANLDSTTEFTNLGQRLVRFGYALQRGTSTVGELMNLAKACGITFQVRAVAEVAGYQVDAVSSPSTAPCE